MVHINGSSMFWLSRSNSVIKIWCMVTPSRQTRSSQVCLWARKRTRARTYTGPVRCEGSWQARRETSLKVAALSCSLACLSKENVTSRLHHAIDNRQGRARQHYKDCHACFIHYCFLTSLSSSKSSRKPQRPVKQRAVPGPDRCPPVCTNKCPSSWPWTYFSLPVCLDEPLVCRWLPADMWSVTGVERVLAPAYQNLSLAYQNLSLSFSSVVWSFTFTAHWTVTHTRGVDGISLWPSFVCLSVVYTSCQLVFLEKSCSDEEHEVALSKHVNSIIICQGSNDIIRSFFYFWSLDVNRGLEYQASWICLIRAHAFLNLCHQKRFWLLLLRLS